MKNLLNYLKTDEINKIEIHVEDLLFNELRETLIKNGNWKNVGEENLGELVNDMLRKIYFQE